MGYKKPVMSHVYLLGVCQFEVIAVQSLLASMAIVSESLLLDEENTHITESDIVVLCLSAPMALGWAKYLSLVKKVYDRFEAKVIVLVPEHIPQALFFDERVRFLCGKLPSRKISTLLLKMIRRSHLNSREEGGYFRGVFRYWVLKDFVEGVSVPARAVRQGLKVKTIFHHRLSMGKSLGFSSYSRMRICFAGCDDRTMLSLRERVI